MAANRVPFVVRTAAMTLAANFFAALQSDASASVASISSSTTCRSNAARHVDNDETVETVYETLIALVQSDDDGLGRRLQRFMLGRLPHDDITDKLESTGDTPLRWRMRPADSTVVASELAAALVRQGCAAKPARIARAWDSVVAQHVVSSTTKKGSAGSQSSSLYSSRADLAACAMADDDAAADASGSGSAIEFPLISSESDSPEARIGAIVLSTSSASSAISLGAVVPPSAGEDALLSDSTCAALLASPLPLPSPLAVSAPGGPSAMRVDSLRRSRTSLPSLASVRNAPAPAPSIMGSAPAPTTAAAPPTTAAVPLQAAAITHTSALGSAPSAPAAAASASPRPARPADAAAASGRARPTSLSTDSGSSVIGKALRAGTRTPVVAASAAGVAAASAASATAASAGSALPPLPRLRHEVAAAVACESDSLADVRSSAQAHSRARADARAARRRARGAPRSAHSPAPALASGAVSGAVLAAADDPAASADVSRDLLAAFLSSERAASALTGARLRYEAALRGIERQAAVLAALQREREEFERRAVLYDRAAAALAGGLDGELLAGGDALSPEAVLHLARALPVAAAVTVGGGRGSGGGGGSESLAAEDTISSSRGTPPPPASAQMPPPPPPPLATAPVVSSAAPLPFVELAAMLQLSDAPAGGSAPGATCAPSASSRTRSRAGTSVTPAYASPRSAAEARTAAFSDALASQRVRTVEYARLMGVSPAAASARSPKTSSARYAAATDTTSPLYRATSMRG